MPIEKYNQHNQFYLIYSLLLQTSMKLLIQYLLLCRFKNNPADCIRQNHMCGNGLRFTWYQEL